MSKEEKRPTTTADPEKHYKYNQIGYKYNLQGYLIAIDTDTGQLHILPASTPLEPIPYGFHFLPFEFRSHASALKFIKRTPRRFFYKYFPL